MSQSADIPYTAGEAEVLKHIRKGKNSAGELAKALGTDSNTVSKRMYSSMQRGRFRREGESGSYRYFEIGDGTTEVVATLSPLRGAVPRELSAEGLGPASQDALDAIRAGATTIQKLAKALGITNSTTKGRMYYLLDKNRIAVSGPATSPTLRALSEAERKAMPPKQKRVNGNAVRTKVTKDGQAVIDSIAAGNHTLETIGEDIGISTRSVGQRAPKLVSLGLVLERQPRRGYGHAEYYLPSQIKDIEAPSDSIPAMLLKAPSSVDPYPFPPGSKPTEAPAKSESAVTVEFAPLIDAIMNVAAPVIDTLTKSLAGPIAAYMMSSLQNNISAAMNSAIRTMPMPEIRAEPVKKLKISIAGLLGYQSGEINNKFSKYFDFKFIDSNHVSKRALDGVQHSDLVVMMTGFVNHAQVDGIKATGAKIEWSNGGMEQLKIRLRNLAALTPTTERAAA